MATRVPSDGVEDLARRVLRAAGQAPHAVFALDPGTSRDGFKVCMPWS
jgi:hypothetical protein